MPGADQAVMTGMQLPAEENARQSRADGNAQTQEANMALLMCAAWAAW
jgi:hypothetical protein